MKIIALVLLAVLCVPALREPSQLPAAQAEWQTTELPIGADGLQASVQAWMGWEALTVVFSHSTVDKIRQREVCYVVAQNSDRTASWAVIASLEDGVSQMRTLRVAESPQYALSRLEHELGWELFRPSQ